MTTIKNLLSMAKGLLLSSIACLAFCITLSAQGTQPEAGRYISKTFKVCPFNVDGLPKTISILGFTININNDGLEEEGAIAIGKYIANSNIDVFALSEDFNFHPSLAAQINDEYTFGTYRGGISTSNLSGTKVNTDGLEDRKSVV